MDLPVTLAPSVDAPFTIARPVEQIVPLVFTSPHSGRAYPPELLATTRLDPTRLRRSEDGFVDELFAAAPAAGAPLLGANFPRAFCDPNREAWELDPGMFVETLPAWVNTSTPRVGAGLGTVPRVVASGEAIYAHKLNFAEAEARIRGCWHPFHAALRELIDATRRRFGSCLLLDCHSMPAGSMAPKPAVDIVLGDAHGTACTPDTAARVERALRDQGFSVRRNEPYAGGYITRHYGRPAEGVQAVQIEINRGLYMDELLISRLPGFPAMQARITATIAALASQFG